MYGRTAVDLISVAGSLSEALSILGFCDVSYKRIGVSVGDKDRSYMLLFLRGFDQSYKHLTTSCLTD